MTKTNFELSEKLKNKINQEFTEEDKKEIYSSFHRYNMITYFFKYVTDSKFRQAVWLHEWLKEQADKDNPIIEQASSECINSTYDLTIQNICRYWYTKLFYKDDYSNYGKFEYWADIESILANYKGDCEDFMLLIYLTALKAGIPEYRIYCTIGWVSGNNGEKVGHAYVTYISDNLVQYQIDGTYYPQESMKMVTPYFDNPLYFYGKEEWARFNTESTFRLK